MGKVLVPEDPAHFSHLGHPNVSALSYRKELLSIHFQTFIASVVKG